jgi:ryanodine receptor 2
MCCLYGVNPVIALLELHVLSTHAGLIIDSFGELRDKEETLTNEMQTKCFVCGLPKSEFDHIPHGFDNHISREHNMAHYM